MCPEAKTVGQRPARAGDALPGPLAEGEDEAVDGGEQGEGGGGGAGEGEGGVRVGVGEGAGAAVGDEGDGVHENVDEGVEEEEGDLLLGGVAALAELGGVEVWLGGEEGGQGEGLPR